MKSISSLSIVAICLLFLAGCVGVSLGTPRIWEERQVTSLQSGRKLILVEPLTRTAHERGGADLYHYLMPAGVYQLEAEDNEYLYYRCASKIVAVVQKAGQSEDGRPLDGGIFVAKAGSNARYQGGGYIDWDNGAKLLLVTLDSYFFDAEGRYWHYGDEPPEVP